jgi:hypothetical protein
MVVSFLYICLFFCLWVAFNVFVCKIQIRVVVVFAFSQRSTAPHDVVQYYACMI